MTIRCNCTDDDNLPVDVRWYDPNGGRIPSLANRNYFVPDAPQFIRENDERIVLLLIPTFNDSYDGTYTCGRKAINFPVSPSSTLNLILDGELKIEYIIFVTTDHVQPNMWSIKCTPKV